MSWTAGCGAPADAANCTPAAAALSTAPFLGLQHGPSGDAPNKHGKDRQQDNNTIEDCIDNK